MLASKVFEDGASYRSRLKAFASQLITAHYKEELEPEIGDAQNQLHYQEIIRTNVEGLICGGKFLRGGVDENVSNSTLEDSRLT